jgi:L-alanine-DL-glutamate epimerase-like enolase superfamily enzyme
MMLRSRSTASVLNRRDFLKAPLFVSVLADVMAEQPAKITQVLVYKIEIPVTKDEAEAGLMYAFSVVEVATSAGVTGYSFAGPNPSELPAIQKLLIGRDLYEIEGHLKLGLRKWGGVEHAIWDAIGKLSKQPVYKLLGGSANRVKAYLTCVWKGPLDQNHVSYRDQAEMASRVQKAGFKGMKIRAWRPKPLDDAAACGEIRAAVGPDFDIMFDRTAHVPQMAGQKVWDYATGLQVAKALEKHRALWLEEPFARDDFESPAKLAGEVDILITGGEGYIGTEDFRRCLTQQTYDIVQPEGRGSGGIYTCRQVATMAEAFHVPCVLHGTMSLMLAGWLQASLAIGSEWQEVALITPPLLPEQQWAPGLKVLRTPKMFAIEDGAILAPELPGLGLDVNPDALKEYRKTSKA